MQGFSHFFYSYNAFLDIYQGFGSKPRKLFSLFFTSCKTGCTSAELKASYLLCTRFSLFFFDVVLLTKSQDKQQRMWDKLAYSHRRWWLDWKMLKASEPQRRVLKVFVEFIQQTKRRCVCFGPWVDRCLWGGDRLSVPVACSWRLHHCAP